MFSFFLYMTLFVVTGISLNVSAQTTNREHELRWKSGGDPDSLSKLEQIGKIHPALPKTRLLSAAESYFEVDNNARAGDEVVGRVNLANNSFEKAHFSITGGSGEALFTIEDFVNSRGKSFGVILLRENRLVAESYTLNVTAQFTDGLIDEQLYTIYKVDEPLAEKFLTLKEKEFSQHGRLTRSAPDREIQVFLSNMTSDGSFKDLRYAMGRDGWENTCASAERLLMLSSAYLRKNSTFYNNHELKKVLYRGIIRNAEQNAKFRTDWADTHVWRNSDFIAGIGIRFYRMLCAEMKSENKAVSRQAIEVYDAILDVCDVMWAERMYERPAIGNANRNHRLRSLITRAAISYDYNRALTDQDVWYDTVDPRIPGYYPNGVFGDVMELIETGFIFMDTYVNRNGFFPDGTICHHPAMGIQFTADAYGWQWLVENSIPMANFLKNTPYRAKSVTYNILADRLLDTYRSLTFNGYLDISVGGLLPDRSKWGPNLLKAVTGLIEAKSEDTIIQREKELLMFKSKLENNHFVDELTLNQPFWNIDYIIHRRPGYFASAKMISKRSRGLERGIDRRSYYYLGDGALFIRVNKDDYNGIDDVFNWHAIPGTTAEQRNDVLPLAADSPFPGANGTNIFAGIVSDGLYGFGAFVYERNHPDETVNYSTVNANKGYFFFEDEMVALGNNIRRVRPGDGREIWTVLNQIAWKSEIVYEVDKRGRETIPLNASDAYRSFPKIQHSAYFYHDKVGYVLLPGNDAARVRLSAESRAKDKRIFQLVIEHGENPQADAYGYIVLPNVSPGEVAEYAASLNEQPSIVILRNDEAIMAVQHKVLKITQIAFYQAGRVTVPSPTKNPMVLSVDRQALVMLRELEDTCLITVTDPNHSTTDTTITLSVNRKLSGPNCSFVPKEGVSRLFITHSAKEVYAGKPKTASFRLTERE